MIGTCHPTTFYRSLSLGTQKSTALDQAVTALVNAGIIMVVSERTVFM
jgi:hypothetical protein